MNIVHTKDIDALFFAKLDTIAAELGARPIDMMSVMFSESGCRADAWNDNPKNLPPEKRWNASGLIQFMPFILPGVGWFRKDGGGNPDHAAFRRLTATEQLPYVHRYYSPYRGHLGSIGQLYTATFLPALIERAGDPEYVLTAKGGRLGWAYGPNAAFDANHDLKITVGELEDAVMRNCKGPRWVELLARLEGTEMPEGTTDGDIDLGTTLGVQRALERIGYDPGPIDGLPGKRTSAAVEAFQRDRASSTGLTVDGIYGPKTREALDIALRTAS